MTYHLKYKSGRAWLTGGGGDTYWATTREGIDALALAAAARRPDRTWAVFADRNLVGRVVKVEGGYVVRNWHGRC